MTGGSDHYPIGPTPLVLRGNQVDQSKPNLGRK